MSAGGFESRVAISALGDVNGLRIGSQESSAGRAEEMDRADAAVRERLLTVGVRSGQGEPGRGDARPGPLLAALPGKQAVAHEDSR